NPPLMFGPVWFARDAAELSLIIARARRTNLLDCVSLNGERDRGNARHFNGARRQPHRLMTKLRGGDQERGLHFVMLQTINKLRYRHLNERGRVRNKAAETPECRVELTDNSVCLKLAETCQRNLRVHILLNKGVVVAARCKL